MEYVKEDGKDTDKLDLSTREAALEAAQSASAPIRQLLEVLIGKVSWPKAKAAKAE